MPDVYFPPELLGTFEGCTEAMRRVREAQHAMHQQLQTIERGRPVAELGVDDRDRAAFLRAEREALELVWEDIRQMRKNLDAEQRLRFERTFLIVAKETLDADVYSRLCELANSRVTDGIRRRDLVGSGSAVPPIARPPRAKERRP